MPYKDKAKAAAYMQKYNTARREEQKEYMKTYGPEYNRRPEVISKLRLQHVQRTYNLNSEEYLQMILDQNNKCAVCNKVEECVTQFGDVRPLCVDHDHTTGKVRALLCNHCNAMLGHSRDSIDTLQKGAEYLKKYSV